MKWIRRKPSLKVRWWVSFSCVLFLFTMPAWVGGFSPGFGDTQSSWGSVFYVHGMGLRSRPLSRGRYAIAALYYVIERDGRFVIVTEDDDAYEAAKENPASIACLYRSGFYQSGLWNPTRWHEVKRLAVPYMRFPDDGFRFFPLTPANWQMIRLALISERGIDPRLTSNVEIADGHVIWTGYLANALSLLALLGLAWAFIWSVAWVPGWFRQCRQRERRAKGLCPMCAYNLEGTPDRCPECGWGQGDATAN